MCCPVPGLARAVPGREEEEAAKGTATTEGCTWHRPACTGRSRDLSLLQKGMGEEQEVSAPWMGANSESSGSLGSPSSQFPPSRSPRGATSLVCGYRNGQSLCWGCSSVTRLCLTSNVGQKLEKLEKIVVKFSVRHARHCRTIWVSRPQPAPGAEKLLPGCDRGR